MRTVSVSDIVNGGNSIIRDIKLSILSGDLNLNIVPNIGRLKRGNNFIFNKRHWKLIRKHKHNCIITGSAALLAFGLIDRMPKDVDLILMSDESNESKILVRTLQRGKYVGDPVDLLGSHYDSGYAVDFFEYKDSIRYIEHDGYKFEHPLDILNKKMLIMKNNLGGNSRTKDYFDVHKILQRLNYVD